MNAKTKKIVGIVAALVVIAAVVIAGFALQPKTQEGAKTVTIEVVNKAEQTTTYTVHTDAEYLKQVMDEADGLTYVGEEGEYGTMVNTVNGETADYSVDSSYWAFYVNDDYCNYGISEQPVADGDTFRIVYTISEW